MTKQACKELKREYVSDMAGESFDKLYADAVERYNAVAMTGEIERVVVKCVAE